MPIGWVERCARTAAAFPRDTKISIAMAVDALAVPVLIIAAVTLRRASLHDALSVPLAFHGIAAALTVSAFWMVGLYRAVVRFIAPGALVTTTLGAVLAAAMLAGVNRVLFGGIITINAIVIFGALLLLYLLMCRSLVREAFSLSNGKRARVVIYGAGATGAQLARALRDGGHYLPVAFVDSDVTLQGSVVTGIPVHAPEQLSSLIKRKRISCVLLAMPSCSRRRRLAILKSLELQPVSVRTVPDVGDIVSGHAKVADVRDVDATDLLGRDPVAPDQALLGGCIRNKIVMVSGAGGSIGSELCRQIVCQAPRRLVLLEISEHGLYQIERELRALAAAKRIDVELVPLLGSVRHRPRMREIMHKYGVHTVYHAAAYKHVPIVEQNVFEGIHNNVFSTLAFAEAALEAKVETFVLISTDKAVNPTNVMGATKRLAELTLQAMQERSSCTRFCMVRFGNVLESSGSVVPLFREQIRRGGPVTVTHKDIIRYFMTIPEASQLVLQASSMARGGEVFVLDMSEPVRIDDLARRMIRLMGLTVRDEQNPEGDIEIVYTGLRPAEKLYEELLIGNNVTGTRHPMIRQASEPHLSWQQLHMLLDEILAAVEAFDYEKSYALLMQTATKSLPQSGLQDLVWLRAQQFAAARGNVASLEQHRQRQARVLN
jgi:FlaA1/EpsC-like NDP-sugar epimerase